MTARLPRIAIIASLLIGIGAMAAACGGDDGTELTLEAYLERMAEIGQDFNTSGGELQTEFEERQADASTETETIDVLVDFIAATIDVFSAFVDDADGLEPPPEAEDAHNSAVTSARGVVDVLRDAEDDLEDAATESEALDVVVQLLESAVVTEFDQSCFVLQAIADEESIDVDLECSS